MLKLNLKCHKHPGFNPLKSGPASIKGGCDLCFALYTLVAHVERLKRLPTGFYWDGIGTVTMPLALLLAPKKRKGAKAWKDDGATQGTLFEGLPDKK